MNYQILRRDNQGEVLRFTARYVGDAGHVAEAMANLEVNPCLWIVKRVQGEDVMLMARYRYEAGKVTKEV